MRGTSNGEGSQTYEVYIDCVVLKRRYLKFLKNVLRIGLGKSRRSRSTILKRQPQRTASLLSSSFTYRITSVSDQGKVIQCNVSVDGLGQTDVQFTFVLNKHHLKLESAGFSACPTAPTPSQKQLAGWKNHLAPASKGSNTVISEFLKTLKQTLASHDSTAIGKIFDDNFVFKGCKGSYSKAEPINKIAQIPKEASFHFTLKSSNWNKDGQINYTVTVSGALRDDFEAKFVYCPYRKVLKSGSILSCPSTSSRRKRMFAEDESCLLWPLLCF